MSTVVQAAEHIVVESATAIVTQVATSTAGDLKVIESSVVKEAVSATDENVPSLLDKVQDGIADVASEVMKGTESAVEAIEQHPEIIAEGALAIAIGAASLVQPELVAGEVALIGKMAADSAKKSINTIASDAGSKVVKAISKDIADDAKEEQDKDVAAKVAKEKAEGNENRKEGTPETSDSTAAIVETPKDAPKVNVSAKVTPDPNPATVERAKDDLKGSISSSSDAKATPASDAAPKDSTIAIEVSQVRSKAVSSEDGRSSESKADSTAIAPVSLKITLGADGEVKAVTKGSDTSITAAPVPAAEPLSSKETSVQRTTKTAKTAKTAIVATESLKPKEDGAPKTEPSVPQPPPVSEKTQNTVQEALQVINGPLKEDQKMAEEAPMPASSSEERPETTQDVLQTIEETHKASTTAIVSAVATVKTTTKTSKTATDEQPPITEGSKMVTVSQESLNLLHQKIDMMHEAIQNITKVLAYHMPTPPSGDYSASGTTAMENVEEIINDALATAVKPLTDLIPEIMSNSDDLTHSPLEDSASLNSSPKRPTAEKRTSVLGSIGKVFWSFGTSEKVGNVTVTRVSSD